MLLHLDYRDSRPIYVQIMDALRQQIASGVLLPEEKLPSVRELAASLSINPIASWKWRGGLPPYRARAALCAAFPRETPKRSCGCCGNLTTVPAICCCGATPARS